MNIEYTSNESALIYNQHIIDLKNHIGDQVLFSTSMKNILFISMFIEIKNLKCMTIFDLFVQGGTDSCEGDSGGPAVVFDDQEDRGVLVGLTRDGNL